MALRHFPVIPRRVPRSTRFGKREDLPSRIFDGGLIVLIFLDLAAIVLESFREISAEYGRVLRAFERLSIGLFSTEYFLRIATADFIRPRLGLWSARARWMLSFQGIIDLLAILPFFLPLLIPFDLRFIRMIRVIRLLRIFKMQRYSRSPVP